MAVEPISTAAPPANLEAMDAARGARLRYVSDAVPGIRRLGAGKHFRYLDAEGRPIADAEEIVRIKQLAIPPAWTDVWICPSPNGHLQATGRDARGRKQYRYHKRWREVRDSSKYERLIAFGEALPHIRTRIQADLARTELVRERVLAAVVWLLDASYIRVGNEEYVRQNKSFGLTTMRQRHVEVAGSKLRFEFLGKAGKLHQVSVRDRRLAAVVRRCQELPGHQLFQYLDGDDVRHGIDSEDVNDYIREAAGDDFSAKDFRTWGGTVLAACALCELGEFASDTEAKRFLAQAVDAVARRLGNTPAICRKCYVHPDVVDAYLDGRLLSALDRQPTAASRRKRRGLSPEEQAVLVFLKRGQRTARAPRRGSRAPRLRPALAHTEVAAEAH